MNEDKVRKVIIVALAGTLIGSLLFIFGVSIENSIWPMIVNYIIGMLLYIASFLAIYNNNKLNPQPLYKYILLIDIGLMALISLVTFSNFI